MSDIHDTNYESHAQETDKVLDGTFWVPPNPPLAYDDILKFSQCEHISINGFAVPGGREDCIDAVRGKDIKINDCILTPNGDGAVTLKGSIDGWAIRDTVIKPGKKRDIEIGQFDNYWYPGRPPTRNGIIQNVSSGTDKPVRVLLWDAERPAVATSNVRVTKIPWIIWFPYFCYRYVAVRRAGVKTT